MADTHGSADSDFDLTQFYQVFFEEAAENLDQMEQMLLNLDLTQANDEELNGIFRCAHSIKGGSATFGFTDVAELTHKMESLLDRLRRHEITPIPEMVDALLESADASRSLLARHQAGGAGEAVATGDLVRRIVDLAAGNRPNAAPAPTAVAAPTPQAPAPIEVAAAAPALAQGERLLQLKIGPVENLEAVDAIKELFRDIPGLGSIEDLACDQPQHRLFQVKTQATNDDLLDLMVFHVSKEQVHITDQVGAVPSATAPMAMGLADPDAALMEADVDHIQPYGLFDGAPGIPDTAVAMPSAAETDAVKTEAPKAAVRANMAQMESTSIRVDVKKVDQLINLAGELVIIQAMLAQNSQTLDPTANQQLLSGLADLDRTPVICKKR